MTRKHVFRIQVSFVGKMIQPEASVKLVVSRDACLSVNKKRGKDKEPAKSRLLRLRIVQGLI